MTISLAHLNPVGAGFIGGWNCHRKVLALPGSSFSSRQVVPSSNLNQCHNNNYKYIQFSLKLSTVQSRPITMVASSKQSQSCSSGLEGEDNFNNNNAKKFVMMMMNMGSAAGNPAICYRNTLSRILASLLSYGLVFAFTITLHTLYSRNSALAVSHDRIGGSLLSLSSLSLSSISQSCSCNCQNSTSPSININIVLPYSLQLCASLTVTILANLYSKLLHPLLDQLMMSKRHGSLLFFQVAVLDKERALRRKIKKIAENADTSTLNGLNYVLKEVVKALLQYNDSFINYTKLEKRCGSMMDLIKSYEEFLNRELQRHGEDESTLVNEDENVEDKNKASMVKANSSAENEYTVVTVLVLANGKHLIPYFKQKGRNCHDSFEVFQTLKRIPENEIQSVEVLWSPRKDDEVLLGDNLMRHFPRLKKIENGVLRMKGGP